MNKDIKPTDLIVMAYNGLTNGPIHEKLFYAFVLVCIFFGAIVAYDGIQGRNCSRGFIANDPMTYASAPACFVRGFIEPLPRPRGYERNNSRRP